MSASLPQRKRLRHEGYDYRKSGAYFVTICIEDGLPLLGQTDQDTVVLSDAGDMVTEVWNSLPNTFPSVKLDVLVVMPNHIHFVIWLMTAIAPETVTDTKEQGAGEVEKIRPSLLEVM